MIEFKFGLFTSFLLFIWLIIEYTLLVPNYHQFSAYLSYIAVLIPVAGIYFGIRERKNKVNFGYISFKGAFRTGIIITLIVAVFVTIFVYVYYEYINPGFVNYLGAETEKKLLQDGVSRDEINASVEVIKYRYSLNIQMIQQLIFILIGGAVVSFVTAMLLKKITGIKQRKFNN